VGDILQPVNFHDAGSKGISKARIKFSIAMLTNDKNSPMAQSVQRLLDCADVRLNVRKKKTCAIPGFAGCKEEKEAALTVIDFTMPGPDRTTVRCQMGNEGVCNDCWLGKAYCEFFQVFNQPVGVSTALAGDRNNFPCFNVGTSHPVLLPEPSTSSM
jgi:hypothetical protein